MSTRDWRGEQAHTPEWRRIFHARHHLTELAREVDAYRERNANKALRSESNAYDGQDPYVRLVYYYDVEEPVPFWWGLLVSDAIHNMQGALDNIVWTLSVQHSGPNPPHPRSIAFPTCRTPDDFDRDTIRSLGAVDPVVRAAIKGLQQFEEEWDFRTLRLVHELNRLDKHRSLHVVLHRPHTLDVKVTPTPRELEVRLLHKDRPLVYGAPVARVWFTRSDRASSQVEVARSFAYYEAIEETSTTPLLPLGGFLENAILDVGKCVEHLSTFIDRSYTVTA